MKKLDVKGQKFGRLTVIEEAPPRTTKSGRKERYWYCKCDCGNPNIKAVNQNSLVSGDTVSCGCMRKEKASKSFSKEANFYLELNEETIILFDKNNNQCLIDKKNYDKIKKYRWYKNKRGYWLAWGKDEHTTVILHRLLLGLTKEDKRVGDHINTNKSDNRECNLRICTHQQNCWNKEARGYYTRLRNGKTKYIAEISKDGKKYHIGEFFTEQEAITARKKFEKELFGEYAYNVETKEE